MVDRRTITVLGTGAWGSVLAGLLSRRGHQVRSWSRRGSLSLQEAIAGADLLVSAISMRGVSELIGRLQALSLPSGLPILSATKGLDPATLATPSQLFEHDLPDHPVAVLSGPNLSREIEAGLPCATVVACRDAVVAHRIQQWLSSDRFRVYTNTDPLGTELGGTLKNVIAIAVGVSDGLQLGSNAKAALITRALAEVIRVGLHLGARVETFYGLSGLGDMLATCDGPLSRNYQVGLGLARGETLESVLAGLVGTAEGVNTARVLRQLVEREGITTPISREVCRLLDGEITPAGAIARLMERELTVEIPVPQRD